MKNLTNITVTSKKSKSTAYMFLYNTKTIEINHFTK